MGGCMAFLTTAGLKSVDCPKFKKLVFVGPGCKSGLRTLIPPASRLNSPFSGLVLVPPFFCQSSYGLYNAATKANAG